MLGTFPKAFSKRQFPKGYVRPSGRRGLQWGPSAAARMSLGTENCSYDRLGKLPLGKVPNISSTILDRIFSSLVVSSAFLHEIFWSLVVSLSILDEIFWSLVEFLTMLDEIFWSL